MHAAQFRCPNNLQGGHKAAPRSRRRILLSMMSPEEVAIHRQGTSKAMTSCAWLRGASITSITKCELGDQNGDALSRCAAEASCLAGGSRPALERTAVNDWCRAVKQATAAAAACRQARKCVVRTLWRQGRKLRSHGNEFLSCGPLNNFAIAQRFPRAMVDSHCVNCSAEFRKGPGRSSPQ